MIRHTLAAVSIAVAGSVAFSASAIAQNYPDRPVRVIVPYAPGGGGGNLTLLVADYLSKRLGQNFLVENKPGAGSAVGLDLLAKSKPDGYTIGLMTSDGISILPAVRKSMPYKVPEDFAYIAGVVKYSYAVALHGKLPHKTFGEVLTWAKANPGKFRYATAGIGGGSHLMGALIEKTAGVQLVHVPFNGGGPAVNGTVGGHVDAIIVTPAIVKPHHDTGALRIVATTDKERHPNVPEAQTLHEAGLTGLAVTGYYGYLAPAGTPEPILEKLRAEFKTMLQDPEIIAKIDKFGFDRSFLPGDAFKNFLMEDLKRWQDVAKAANISLPD